jgi:uncharacterized protein involved in cysteine biosynthesis
MALPTPVKERVLPALKRLDLPPPRWMLGRLRAYSKDLQPPPGAGSSRTDRAVYGFAQPLLAIKVLLTDPNLLREALEPALLLAAFCAVVAFIEPEEGSFWIGRLKTFYKVFAALAPVPSILFAKHYARLAALTRWRLGFGACGPRELPLRESLKRAVQQLVLVYAGAFPFWLVLRAVPFLGRHVELVVPLIWGLHWIVVDAFDDARVLRPGESLRDAEAEDQRSPSPWFVRWFRAAADRIPFAPFADLLRWFADVTDRLALVWRGEIALMEKNGAAAVGFSLSTAALLATPVLNLLFRPVTIVAAAHLLGHLEGEGDSHTASLNAAETHS